MGIPEFYIRQDTFTDPGPFAGLYDDLPESAAELRDIVSRLIIHVAWASRYEIASDVPMSRETRPASARLGLSQSLQAGPLCVNRPPDKRSFGTCRDYAVILCGMLRHHSIPARIRCGFATYFTACPFEDHWICEWWSSQDGRWIRADAQLDRMHREQLEIGFDAADLPSGAFLTAPQAWQLTRRGGADCEDFGQANTRGPWFIQVDVYRDLLALTNQYISDWDTWRTATAEDKVLSAPTLTAIDSVALAIGDFEAGTIDIDQLKEIALWNQIPPWRRRDPSGRA